MSRDDGCFDDPADSMPADVAWQPIDLLLHQGSDEEVGVMRNEVARDPLLAMGVAETVALLEECQSIRTDASAAFAGKMKDVVMHSDRFARSHGYRKSPFWQLPMVMSLAATATFFALWWSDAGQLLQKSGEKSASVASIRIDRQEHQNHMPVFAGAATITSEQASWDLVVKEIDTRLELEAKSHLRDAFRAGVADDEDPMRQWLDPRNAMVLLRLEHELRASADVRAQALRACGDLPEIDDRVQELAQGISESLMQKLNASAPVDSAATIDDVRDVALSIRALVAAGADQLRSDALSHGGDWLAARVSRMSGERLVVALSGLVEIAAARGDHFDAVELHGQRLVDEVLRVSEDTWRRRRPELLSGGVAAGSLGEAGRVLARLPAFGIEPAPCKLVRQLVLGQLRERREIGQDRPEVLAAMLYGYGELLTSASNERDRISLILRRWKPKRLAPDFVTVQQIAWSRPPGSRGYTRLQQELRQLAVLPDPDGQQNRAAFCLCLATNFAGFVGTLLPTAAPLRRS